VAVGQGTTNTIAYSNDGITWIGLGLTLFTTIGYDITWNGTRFVAVGEGLTHTIAHSTDGITWRGVGTTIFTTTGRGVAGNSNVGSTIVDSAISFNSNIYPNSNKLDIVSDNYYNAGYSNFSVDIVARST
jgi:hypothetical protein